MLRAVALVVVLGAVAALTVPVAPLGASAVEPAPAYEHPVDAEIVDPFRPPPTPFGSGNRGLKYATSPGDPVRAAAPGVVVFAGQAGGTLHVTVAHPDGRLTSYSGVGSIEVHHHQRVDGGAVVALAGGPLHVGVREGGEYVDPEALFGGGSLLVRLVPESPLGEGSGDALTQVIAELRRLELERGGGGGLARLGRLVDRVGGWGRSVVAGGSSLLGLALDTARYTGQLAHRGLAAGGSIGLQALWHAAPYLLALHNPVVAGVVFNVVVPLLSGEIPPVVLFAADLVETPIRLVERTLEWWEHRRHCTPQDQEPPLPEGRRVALLVGGLDSTSEHAAIGGLRTDELGYDDADVVAFSYAGGRAPGRLDGSRHDTAADLASLPVTTYSRAESAHDLASRGAILADLLTDIHRSSPGTPVDLFAHSQGGLVTRTALVELEHRPGGREVIDSLGLVATIASPHDGADLASMSVAVSGSLDASIALRTMGVVTGSTVHPRGTNIADLARGSDLLGDLADAGLPEGPSYLTLAGRGDPVVTEARSRLPGVTHATLPGWGFDAHSQVVSQPATTRELALGLAGLPPTCRGLFDFLGDTAVAELTQLGSSIAGFGLSIAAVPISPVDIAEPLVRW